MHEDFDLSKGANRVDSVLDKEGTALNHAPQGVTQRHYAASHSPKDKRNALMKWDAYLDALVNGSDENFDGGNIRL